MDKQELFDKAVEIALSRDLIKDSGDLDSDKSWKVVVRMKQMCELSMQYRA